MRSFVWVVPLLALLLSACTPPGTLASPPPAASAAETPKRGGTLTVDTGRANISTLDTLRATVPLDRHALGAVTESLVRRDKDGQLQPLLATSWKVDTDQLTWTFELRKAVKFSDGTPFNAEAVEANVKRWLNPDVSGLARRFASLARLIDSVDRFSAVDEYTVRFKTRSPQPFVPDLLSGGGTQLVSPTLLKSVGIGSETLGIKTIGTGPFIVESFVTGERLTLVRNEDYWGNRALLDKIIFRHIGDATARTGALVSRQVDLALVVDPTQVPVLGNDPSSIVVVAQAGLDQQWIQMNLQKPPLDKVEVRQALNYAVDMEAIRNVAYEGFIAPFQGPMNPGIFRPDPAIVGFSYDPNKARELLARVGVTSLKLTLSYDNTQLTTRHAEMLQAQLREVGVELQLQLTNTAALAEFRDNGRHQLANQGHGNSAYIPVLSYATTLKSNSAAYSRPNGYANPRIDDLISRALLEVDREKQVQLLNEIHREFVKDPPWLAPYTRTLLYAYSSRVVGFTSHPDQAVAYERIWLK